MAQVEYQGGPFDGRTENIPVPFGGLPRDVRILDQPEYKRSVFDDIPLFPAEQHMYRRTGTEPAHRDGADVWIYTWSPPQH